MVKYPGLKNEWYNNCKIMKNDLMQGVVVVRDIHYYLLHGLDNTIMVLWRAGRIR